MATPTEQLKELKKIAQIRFDKERHQLTAINEEIARLDQERKALKKQIKDISSGEQASPASLMNAYAYLDALTRKAELLDAERGREGIHMDQAPAALEPVAGARLREERGVILLFL